MHNKITRITVLFVLIAIIIGVAVYSFVSPKSALLLPSPQDFVEKSEDEQITIIQNASKQDPVKTQDYIKSTFLKDGQLQRFDSNVYELTHIFGHIIGYDMYKIHGAKGLTYCDTLLSYACYHGAAQYALAHHKVDSVQELMKECSAVSKEAAFSCSHGIGHGFLLSQHGVGHGHGYLNLHDLDINEALTQCEKEFEENAPSHKDSYRHACKDGVFMEYSLSSPKTAITKDDIWEFCASFSKENQHLCATYAILFLENKANLDFSEGVRLCSTSPTKDLAEGCTFGVNLSIAHVAKGNTDVIKKSCSLYGNADQKNECLLIGGGYAKIKNYYKWKETLQAICTTLKEEAPNTPQFYSCRDLLR